MTLLRNSFACCALIACCGVAVARDVVGDEQITVPLSDPSRPGTVHVSLVMGSISVKGRDIKDVIIEANGPGTNRAIPDEARGLRRIVPEGVGVTVEEQNNRVEIATPRGNRTVHLEIQVPRKTNLEIATVNNGGIDVEGVEGELELGNVNGAIELTDVSGAVVAHTVNGRVIADIKRVTPDKPMAFTSLNGVVDVTLPPTLKANLKLRTDNGSAFTDFEMQMLPAANTPIVEDTRKSRGRYRIEVNKVIYGSVNGGGPEIEMRTFNGNIYLRKGGSASDTAGAPSKR
jgi:DUF4097 and DUF4098 domain-containing protein YvlB